MDRLIGILKNLSSKFVETGNLFFKKVFDFKGSECEIAIEILTLEDWRRERDSNPRNPLTGLSDYKSDALNHSAISSTVKKIIQALLSSTLDEIRTHRGTDCGSSPYPILTSVGALKTFYVCIFSKIPDRCKLFWDFYSTTTGKYIRLQPFCQVKIEVEKNHYLDVKNHLTRNVFLIGI